MKFEDLLADKLEEGKALGIEQGIEQGKAEAKIEDVISSFKMLNDMGVEDCDAIQKIADSFHMSESEVSEIIQKADSAD